MHKHETIMMTRFLMILCRALRHPPGKEDVIKSVGVIFYLFCSCLLQEARLLMLSKWVSESVSQWVMVTIEFPADLDPVFARCSLYYPFFVLEYYRRRETSHNNFTMARKKNQSFPISHEGIGATWKPTGKLFSLNGEYLTVWISKLCPVDRNISFFSVLAVTLQKMINTSK